MLFEWGRVRLLMIAVVLTLSINAYSQSRDGSVTGTIYDPSGDAVMPGVKVLVTNGRKVQTAISDDAGAYWFQLVPGTYQISASSNVLYPLRRSAVAVSSGVRATVNLYPSFRIKTQSLVVHRSGVSDEYSYWPASKFESIASKDGNNYLLEFKNVRILHKVRTFRSTGFERVKITKGSLTVLGREVSVDSRGQIKVVGNVLIDDNGKRTEVENYVLP